MAGAFPSVMLHDRQMRETADRPSTSRAGTAAAQSSVWALELMVSAVVGSGA